jgi:hypothetical protein
VLDNPAMHLMPVNEVVQAGNLAYPMKFYAAAVATTRALSE